MKIEYKRNPEKEVGILPGLAVFEYHGKMFIKTRDTTDISTVRAVCINDCMLYDFKLDDLVQEHEATLVIE